MILIYIIRYIKFIYSLYLINKSESDCNINYVKKCANLCGPLAIKLLQIIITGAPEFVKSDKLNFVFEDCEIHDFKFTEMMYQKEFGNSIHEDYLFEKNCVIGSGSIGQVYKCYCRKTDQFVAIKVKHPDINKIVDQTVFAIKIVCFLLKFINKYHNFFMEYVNNIHLQIDYIQESINTNKLKYNFRNEECIIVPEIYNYTQNFIIMSYYESKKYSDVNEHFQLLASAYINFFYLTSLLVHDYLHADLHQGNWKIIENGNDIKLFIYDCGIMCSTNNLSLNREIIDILTSGTRKFMNLIDVIKKYDNIPIDQIENKLKKHKQELENLCLLNPEKNSASKVFGIFLRKLIDLRLITNINFINLLSSIAIIGDTPVKSISVFVKYILYPTGTNALLYHVYIDILQKMNKFSQFKNYLINYLDTVPEKKEIYSDWLFQEFGHRKGYILTDIIYNQFSPS